MTRARPTLDIRQDDLRGPEVIALLQEHLLAMRAVSPPESCHALDPAGLRQPGITFWSAWVDQELAGCAALKELDAEHAEIKSMRTAQAHLRSGVAARLLDHLLAEAARRGYRRLSLETGSMEYFEPARRLYRSVGFTPSPPFGDYVEDPLSVFLTRPV